MRQKVSKNVDIFTAEGKSIPVAAAAAADGYRWTDRPGLV